jgi:hypothetical protein
MRERIATRLYLAEAEFRAAQRHHDGSPMACSRYRAALREIREAEAEASRFLKRMVEHARPSEDEEVTVSVSASAC